MTDKLLDQGSSSIQLIVPPLASCCFLLCFLICILWGQFLAYPPVSFRPTLCIFSPCLGFFLAYVGFFLAYPSRDSEHV
jgi:hypothetical protein